MSTNNSAKLISYTVVDFTSEAEMELYLVFFEKNGPHHFEQLSTLGCIRWRINRVWNKTGGSFRLHMHISMYIFVCPCQGSN